MSFYLGMPSTGTKYGKEVWSKGLLNVWEWQNRYDLYVGTWRVAELIYGSDGLKKYYKGSFEVWAAAVEKKDLAKSKKMRAEAVSIVQECDFLDRLWRENEDFDKHTEGDLAG